MASTRQLAAIMFTDIVGYTALMGEDESHAFSILHKNRVLHKTLIEKFCGTWIKELGDGVLVSFSTVTDAVLCATSIQKEAKEQNEFKLRIGIHESEVVFEDGDVFGDGVNIASRLQARAPIGGILISEAVYKNVSNNKDIQTRFVGEEKFKNVKEPVRIYEVTMDAQRVSFIPLQFENKTFRAKKTIVGNNQNRNRLFLFAIIIFLLAAIGFSYWFFNDRKAKQIESIAVLPFVNKSGIADVEYVSDGITESLINSLSQLPHLAVKARSSVFHYKGKEVTPQVVGKELNVQAVLSGQLLQNGDQLTLNLDLVDATTGNQIWGRQYIRQQKELVSLQSEIARDVANKLKRLSGVEEQRVTKTYTTDPEAYRLYLQGLYHWNKRTVEDIRKSIVFFQQAIEKDPSYAKAYAGLAMAYLIIPDYIENLTKQELKEVDLKMHAAVRQAQELDDSLAEVHAVLANVKENAWDFVAAENEYRVAIELNPNFASAHSFYSRLLGALGRYEEAFVEVNKAHELDPFSISINFNMGARFADARRFNEAIMQFKRVLEMEPDHPLTHLILARTYDAEGMYMEAIAEYRKADVLLEKASAETAERNASALTHALKTLGVKGYWQKRLELSQQEYDKGYGSAYTIAVIYARMGDRDSVFGQLEKSFAAHETDLEWIKAESAFDAISSDPHFRDLLRRIGLPR